MMHKLLVLLLIAISCKGFSQELPEYINGKNAYKRILNDEISFPEVSVNTITCGYVLGLFFVDASGKVSERKLMHKMPPEFAMNTEKALQQIDAFTTLLNEEKKPEKFIAVQPVGYLFDKKVCPVWEKIDADSTVSYQDSIIYLPEYNIFRNSEELTETVFQDKGMEMVKKGEYEKAIEIFKKGYDFEPENDFYSYHLGICYYHIRQLETACMYLKQAKKMGNKVAKNVYKEKCDF